MRTHGHADGLVGAFAKRLDALLPVPGDALDLGTGTGAVALRVAPRARRVVAVDRDAGRVAEATRRGEAAGLQNVRFVVADAETLEARALNGGVAFRLATAHLFLSPRALGRLAEAVGPGGHVLATGFSLRHWHEAGGSPFAMGPAEGRAPLEAVGMKVEEVRIDETQISYPTRTAAREALRRDGRWEKWSRDGRWEHWGSQTETGRWRLTESFLTVLARRPP